MPSHSSVSRRSSRVRSRSSSSRRRCCASSGRSPPRSSRRHPRRRRWRRRSTRRSRNSRRWWARGTISPKAPTSSSSRDEEGRVTTERRRFIVTAGGALATATAWTKALDLLQGAAQRFAKVVEETSGGRFRIEVLQGGQMMQPFECFDAASRGTIEAFMGSPQYWADREPAIEWFATIPFGMNPEGMAAWYYQGDGLKLMQETY